MREVERHDAQRSSSSALAVREGVEGASAGCLARTIVECLVSFLGGDDDDDDDDNNDHDETKKTRKTNGRKRFSSDRGRTMMRLFAEDFLYFSLVSLVNTTNDARSERNPSSIMSVAKSYAIAGVASTALMLPCDIVSSRVKKKENKKSKEDAIKTPNRMKKYLRAMKDMYKRDGLFAFHRGFSQNVPLIVSHTINFTAFDALKMKYGKTKLTVVESFVIGCAAKTIATAITFPLERTRALVEASKAYHREEEKNSVRKNMIDGEFVESSASKNSDILNNSFKGSTTSDVVQLVLESQGVCGFYDGFTRHARKSVHSSALFFLIREQMRNRR